MVINLKPQKTTFRSNGQEILFALGLFIALGIAGSMDAQDAANEAVIYKTKVCEENMPNYKGLDLNCHE